jgi:hypothetical protein
MNTLNTLRAALVALAACSLLVPAAAMAGPVPPTGTVVGTVSCGAAEVDHAAHILVSLEDIGMSTHTDGSGKFILSNVPANRGFTVDAVGSPDAFVVSSRYNVVVQAGQTVDIGNLDLSVCPHQADPDQQATMDQVSDSRD